MFDLSKLRNNYYSYEGSTDADVQEALSLHWRSFSSMGDSYFSVTPKFAAWLLHNLRHEPISLKEEVNVFHVMRTFNQTGIKGMLPREPILIDTLSNTLVKGRTRLYGLSMAKQGSYLWIEVK